MLLPKDVSEYEYNAHYCIRGQVKGFSDWKILDKKKFQTSYNKFGLEH